VVISPFFARLNVKTVADQHRHAAYHGSDGELLVVSTIITLNDLKLSK